uniref:Exosome complex component RRP45 n=1 Tax=Latimeria chalumnae TaxID=7897 RepID=H3B5T9_LATCH
MRESPLSNCEKQFLLQAIAEKKNLQLRKMWTIFKKIFLSFHTNVGICIHLLPSFMVLAQVSCELVIPKMNRPTEGILFFNLELSPMASPAFEPGRQSELLVKLNRLLERCLRNSKCIDTESLCVVANEKPWRILQVHVSIASVERKDTHTVYEILKCCHSRRPKTPKQKENSSQYTPEERNPIPLSIHHMPICVSFAFFQQGTYLLVDPSEREERVMDGLLVIAMNKHRELCTIQSSGGIMLLKEQVLRCSKIASVKVMEITELIQKALENDAAVRKEGGKYGFAESLPNQRITAFKMAVAPVDTADVGEKAEDIISKAEPPTEEVSTSAPEPVLRAPGTAQIGEGLENHWGVDELEELEELEEDEENEETTLAESENRNMDLSDETERGETIMLSDSEEEDVVILEPEGSQKKVR